jgi:hypothetical protein
MRFWTSAVAAAGVAVCVSTSTIAQTVKLGIIDT